MTNTSSTNTEMKSNTYQCYSSLMKDMYRVMDCSSSSSTTGVDATVSDASVQSKQQKMNTTIMSNEEDDIIISKPNIVEDDGHGGGDRKNKDENGKEEEEEDEFHDAEQPRPRLINIHDVGEPTEQGDNDSSPRSSNLPKAGSSTFRLSETMTQFTCKKVDPHPDVNQNASFLPEWKAVVTPDQDEVLVRPKGYLKSGIKNPSQQTLYDIAAFDLIMSKERMGEISTRVQLPDDNFGKEDKRLKGVYAPKSLIIVLAVPEETPKIGSPRDDGRSLNFILYFQMKDITISILQKMIQNSDKLVNNLNTKPYYTQQEQPLVPAAKLLNKWFQRTSGSDPDTEFASRFKFVPFSPNATSILPSSMYMSKYNGKPLLIKRTGATGLHVNNPAEKGVPLREFCINFHAFPYLAKQAFSYTVRHYLEAFVMRTCFVIEGRDEEELPEVVIGGASICCADPGNIVQGEAFFLTDKNKVI